MTLTIAGLLPAYLGAYVGSPGPRIAPKLTEAIMLTMHDPSTSRLGSKMVQLRTGLHGELARMAGLLATDDETYASDEARPWPSPRSSPPRRAGAAPWTMRSENWSRRILGARRGRGRRARCASRCCGARPPATPSTPSATAPGILAHFGALVTLFYGPLFAVIGALNAALAAPVVPPHPGGGVSVRPSGPSCG